MNDIIDDIFTSIGLSIAIYLFVLIIVLILVYINDIREKRSKTIMIKFNEFKSYYELNPNRFRIFRSNPEFITDSGKTIDISFSFIDQKRYYRWHDELMYGQRLNRKPNDIFRSTMEKDMKKHGGNKQ